MNMSDHVFLFSGQGAQRVGMGRDLAGADSRVRQMFADADAILGFGLSKIMWEGPEEELMRTSRCQPALYLHGLAVYQALRDRMPGLNPVAAAGLSLGEFTAHAAANTLSFAEGLRLVHQRGRFMEEACELCEGAMAAMIGGDPDSVRRLAEDCDIDVANYNAPGQIVVSGTAEGVAAAAGKAREYGIRMAKPLKVAGAYHSRLMKPAQDKLAEELGKTSIGSPRIPVVSNVTAVPVSSPDEVRDTLTRQVTGSVRWVESMQWALQQGWGSFLELGPGKVLTGFMGRIDKENAVCRSLENLADLEALEI